ncbi:FUSC family protein [Novosphingobium aerophilum]|uniref:FUSC family protein n=1 Tax=Novosphingobium aerophilum TaxID=2839843 RepID=UPI003FD385FA
MTPSIADRFGVTDALFSLKCLAAAALAYYLALTFQFPKPFWSVMTAYIVASPMTGAVHSKALFRLSGTAIGAAVAVILLPNLRGSPEFLTLALAGWLGLCIYLAVIDRTARAYMYLLAGFTAILVSMPIIDRPEAVFNTAVSRVQEIALGFFCAGLVHSLVFPRSVSDRLLARVDAIVLDAERWSIDTLDEASTVRLARDRRQLALDIAELHQLSIHLPFDTGRRRLRVGAVRALQQQLAILAPLAAAVEDRLHELRGEGHADARLDRLAAQARDWLDRDDGGYREEAATLRRRAQALEPEVGPDMAAPDLLKLGLLVRLGELIEAHCHCRDLRRQLHAPSRAAVSTDVPALLGSAVPRALHEDRGMALRSGLNAVATVCVAVAFWRLTAWPSGDGAVMIAAICCSLFAGFDQPAVLLNKFLAGWVIATFAAIAYAFAILPRVTEFGVLIAVLAPYLLVGGSLLARPPRALMATGLLLGLLNTVGLNEEYAEHFPTFINVAIAQLAGAVLSVVMLRIFSTVGAGRSAERIVQASWRDIGRFDAPGAPAPGAWIGVALDRIGLLAPRLVATGGNPGAALLDGLNDLRAGAALLRLGKLERSLRGDAAAALAAARQAVAAHYRAQAAARMAITPPKMLESTIDHGIRTLAACEPAHAREGVLALLTLRRVFFPHGHPPGRPPAPDGILDRAA